MAKAPVHRLVDEGRGEGHPGGAGQVVPDQHAGGSEGQAPVRVSSRAVEAILPPGCQSRDCNPAATRHRGQQHQQLPPVVAPPAGGGR